MTFPFVFLNTPAYTGNRRQHDRIFPVRSSPPGDPCYFCCSLRLCRLQLRCRLLPSLRERLSRLAHQYAPISGKTGRQRIAVHSVRQPAVATAHPRKSQQGTVTEQRRSILRQPLFGQRPGQRRMREQRKSEVLGEFGILHPRSPESEFVGRDCTRVGYYESRQEQLT